VKESFYTLHTITKVFEDTGLNGGLNNDAQRALAKDQNGWIRLMYRKNKNPFCQENSEPPQPFTSDVKGAG
jgi:hypothetical protein